MIPYQTRTKTLSGTSYGEVSKKAFAVFDDIKRQTKRQPYIRSAYFKKEKVFIRLFREHLFQKSPKERMARLRYFSATVELIHESRNAPTIRENPNKKETLYRFAGLTAEKELFFVQVKEDRRGNKYLMSCFGAE